MQTIIRIACFIVALLCLAGVASAESKAKPAVCQEFSVFEADKRMVGVCYDGKKPAVWTSWTFVDIFNPETGAKARYAVGFR